MAMILTRETRRPLKEVANGRGARTHRTNGSIFF